MKEELRERTTSLPELASSPSHEETPPPYPNGGPVPGEVATILEKCEGGLAASAVFPLGERRQPLGGT